MMPSQSKPKRKKKRKGAKGKAKKILKFKKPKDIGHFLVQTLSSQNLDLCACPSKHVVKRDAGGKKGMLSCCNLQNVQKMHFLLKAPGVNGLTTSLDAMTLK